MFLVFIVDQFHDNFAISYQAGIRLYQKAKSWKSEKCKKREPDQR